ncbi:hypothetical protein ACWPMX_01860 [Tsuneonella sp. HG094]
MLRALVTGLLALSATAAVAQATDASAGQWQIAPNDMGCSMLRTVSGEGSAAVMVSLNRNQASQIIFFAPGSKIEPGMFYAGVVMWDETTIPLHFLSGGSPEMPGVAIESNDARLIDVIARNERVGMAVLGVTQTTEFPLSGAKEAVANLRKCVTDNTPK